MNKRKQTQGVQNYKLKVLNQKILKSKLNARNAIKIINKWAIPVVWYTAGRRTQAELENLDQKNPHDTYH